MKGYPQKAEQALCILLQVETPQALENIEAMRGLLTQTGID